MFAGLLQRDIWIAQGFSKSDTLAKWGGLVYGAFPVSVTNRSSHHNAQFLSPGNYDTAVNLNACQDEPIFSLFWNDTMSDCNPSEQNHLIVSMSVARIVETSTFCFIWPYSDQVHDSKMDFICLFIDRIHRSLHHLYFMTDKWCIQVHFIYIFTRSFPSLHAAFCKTPSQTNCILCTGAHHPTWCISCWLPMSFHFSAFSFSLYCIVFW